jgi:hypothetical protein
MLSSLSFDVIIVIRHRHRHTAAAAAATAQVDDKREDEARREKHRLVECQRRKGEKKRRIAI